MLLWMCQGNLHKIKKDTFDCGWSNAIPYGYSIWNHLVVKSDAFAILEVKWLLLRIGVIL